MTLKVVVCLGKQVNVYRIASLILVNGKEINVLAGLETEVNEGDEIILILVSHVANSTGAPTACFIANFKPFDIDVPFEREG